MHTARAGQEEHSSQGTAQGDWRRKLRPEIFQKLGGQTTPAPAAAGKEPEEGKAFRTTGHCRSSVCVSIRMQAFVSAGPGHRTNAV